MDADESVPQPPPAPDNPSPPRPIPPLLDARSLLALADHFCHALTEGGAFDHLTGDAAGKYEAAMSAMESGSPAAKRVAYTLILEIVLARPELVLRALQSVRAQLIALRFDEAGDREAAPPPPDPEGLMRTLRVSRRVAEQVELLDAPPVTRWIQGSLYVGATRDRLSRVISTDHEPQHQRVWLTTAERELWLVPLSELTPRASM